MAWMRARAVAKTELLMTILQVPRARVCGQDGT